MRFLFAALLLACRGPARATADPTPAPSNVLTAERLRCPTPKAEQLEHDSAPPWERDPLGRWPICLETNEGGRVHVEKDPTDIDGWRAFLVREEPGGKGFRLPTRAVSSFNLGPDGSVILGHTEFKITRVSREGVVMWSTDIPKCGSPEIVVGHDGSTIDACGFSIVKLTPDGVVRFQKWPFGDIRIGTPFVMKDGRMIVSGGGAVALLDADAEVLQKMSTGGNRYVHKLGALPDGNVVFRTSMAAMHSDGPIHFYYEHEPDEIFVVARDLKLIARKKAGAPWPASAPITTDLRAGRL
jgi:hypothetical protein